jgi:predicted ATPase
MRVVLTGGPHGGKTTLATELRSRGITVVEEGALSVIRELNAAMGDADTARTWRRANMAEFQVLVARRQAELERAALGDLVISDRGTIDGLAYCEHYGAEVRSELVSICAASSYDLCVICGRCS